MTKTDDRVLVKRLIKPVDWITHYWLQNCLSDDKLFVCDFGRLHVCAILFLYLLRNWWVHFKSLLLFHSSTEKKQAHNEEIPGKWLNWITPYWCGRDYYWMPFILKTWHKKSLSNILSFFWSWIILSRAFYRDVVTKFLRWLLKRQFKA